MYSRSVDSLSVVDLKPSKVQTKIVSLAENSCKVSTINLTVNLNHEETSKDPMGQISANIAQIRLLVPVPFVLRTLVSSCVFFYSMQGINACNTNSVTNLI